MQRVCHASLALKKWICNCNKHLSHWDMQNNWEFILKMCVLHSAVELSFLDISITHSIYTVDTAANKWKPVKPTFHIQKYKAFIWWCSTLCARYLTSTYPHLESAVQYKPHGMLNNKIQLCWSNLPASENYASCELERMESWYKRYIQLKTIYGADVTV